MNCHMFSELFVVEQSLQRVPLPHSSHKSMSQFIKKSYTIVLPARFYSPEENLVQSIKKKKSGIMPEISLSQMFQQKVLAYYSLIHRHTGLGMTTAITSK